MSTATSTPVARTGPRQHSAFDRRALAVLMPIGPLAIAIVRGILPYYTNDSNTVMAAKVAGHQGAETAVIWLTFVAMLTLVPGVIALGVFARQGSRRLGTAGLVLAVAAFLSLFWSTAAGEDNVALGAARIGLNPGTTGALVTSMGGILPIGLASNIFVLGHIVGLVLISIALWRGRLVPTWAALLLGVSQLLHFVFAVIVPVHALDGCAWGLTVVGFAAAAVAFARQRPYRTMQSS
jgi:hypothetical protein